MYLSFWGMPGDYRVLAAAKELEDAELNALNRETGLFHVSDLTPCRRVLAVDPDGVIITSAELRYSGTRRLNAEQSEDRTSRCPPRGNFSPSPLEW